MDPISAGILVGGSLLGTGASLWANSINNRNQNRANERNYQAQKEFYQNSVLWRKQDAQRAGINPIYALGAQNANFTPSFESYNSTVGADIGNIANNTAMQFYQARQLKLQEDKQVEEVSYLKALTAKAQAETAKISEKPKVQATPTKADANGTVIGGDYFPYGKATRIKGTGLAFSPITENVGSITFADQQTFQGLGDARAESYLVRTLMEKIHVNFDSYYMNRIIRDLQKTGHAFGKAQNGKIIEIDLDTSAGMPSLWYQIKDAPKQQKTNLSVEKSASDAAQKIFDEYGYTD